MKLPMLRAAKVFPLAVACLAFAGIAPGWAQQSKEQLVGTWLLVSAESIRPDGSRSPTFGPSPKGMMIFGSDGYFSQQLTASGRPKFASKNRLKGTPEENQAMVQGSIGNFGTYSVEEGGKVLVFHVEGSSFPNSEGETQKRPIVTLTRDELKYRTAGTVGAPVESTWKRAR